MSRESASIGEHKAAIARTVTDLTEVSGRGASLPDEVRTLQGIAIGVVEVLRSAVGMCGELAPEAEAAAIRQNRLAPEAGTIRREVARLSSENVSRGLARVASGIGVAEAAMSSAGSDLDACAREVGEIAAAAGELQERMEQVVRRLGGAAASAENGVADLDTSRALANDVRASLQ